MNINVWQIGWAILLSIKWDMKLTMFSVKFEYPQSSNYIPNQIPFELH